VRLIDNEGACGAPSGVEAVSRVLVNTGEER